MGDGDTLGVSSISEYVKNQKRFGPKALAWEEPERVATLAALRAARPEVTQKMRVAKKSP